MQAQLDILGAMVFKLLFDQIFNIWKRLDKKDLLKTINRVSARLLVGEDSDNITQTNINRYTRIFISYARHDRTQVQSIYDNLTRDGFHPWIDTSDLPGGAKWETTIEDAIHGSDFFIACISTHYINHLGYVQKEIKKALSILDGMREKDIYLVPVLLENCTPPRALSSLNYINLYEADGYEKLLSALRIGSRMRTSAL